MRTPPLSIVAVSCLCCLLSGLAAADPAYYVSPGGNDANAGTSTSTPFRTLEKARYAMQSGVVKTTYVMDGTYYRTALLHIDSPSDANTSWRAYPGHTPILDGGGLANYLVAANADNMVVSGLTFQNARGGVAVNGCGGVIIEDNTFRNIGILNACEAQNGAHDVRFSHNHINGVEGRGISTEGDIGSNVTIEYNYVLNTNANTSDSGAIYMVQRAHTTRNNRIDHNIVGTYGNATDPSLVGIYLDDQMSYVTVTNNIVYGPGGFGVMYHGGDHITVANNIFDVSGAQRLGVYAIVPLGSPNYGMASNVFTGNIVYSTRSSYPNGIWGTDVIEQITKPDVYNNTYHFPNWNFTNSGHIVDRSPIIANPLFANPSNLVGSGYALQPNSSAIVHGFIPIDTSGCGPRYSPSITAQPVAKSVNVGQTATFSVAAMGNPKPGYQWQRNGTDISGATSANYTTPAAIAADNNAVFRVVVSNSKGSVTSNAVSLTLVNPTVAPVITGQPQNGSVVVGQTATFTVAATGAPAPDYQWQRNGANISGATSASYTTPATTTADNGATFRVVVRNSAGSATSNAVTLNVTAAGAGWQATYYDNPDFTGVRKQRVDPMIDFAWGTTVPLAGIAANTYSVRWRGLVTVPTSGTWTFTATTDDGVRAWVGGRRIIDGWVDHGATAVSGQAALTAGQPVEVVMEYYQGVGDASARLEWSGPGQARQVIPASRVIAAAGDDLPGGWVGGDIGAVGRVGRIGEADGTWTVTGSGTDIWDNADGFAFVRQTVTGDVRITAKVNAVGNTAGWAKAGVMVRESTAAGSRHAFACVTPVNGVAFQRRLVTGGASSHTAGPAVTAPYWVRVERVGNVLIGSHSANGTTWTVIRRETISMASTVLVGLAVTAHNNAADSTAMFSNVEIVSTPSAAN